MLARCALPYKLYKLRAVTCEVQSYGSDGFSMVSAEVQRGSGFSYCSFTEAYEEGWSRKVSKKKRKSGSRCVVARGRMLTDEDSEEHGALGRRAKFVH